MNNERSKQRKCTACGIEGGHKANCRLQDCPICNDPTYPRHDAENWNKYHGPAETDRSREHGKQ